MPVAGVFVYSSLCRGSEDLHGVEIVLMREPTGTIAVYTRTEGAVLEPLLAYGPDVKIDDSTGHIHMRFVDPAFEKDGIYLFEGVVSDDAMDVTSAGYVGRLRLPRRRTFEATLRACRW
jgi:hypothetical protein